MIVYKLLIRSYYFSGGALIMGICPDCGGWIDEGDCSCSCGSTRGISSYYYDDEEEEEYYSPRVSIGYDYEFKERLRQQKIEDEKRKAEEEHRKAEEELKKERERQRIRAEKERRQREYERLKKLKKEENEKNPEYLAEQIEKIKGQIYRNRIFLARGPEHLNGIQKKIDNAFKEIIRLEDKLAAFEIPESDEFEYLNEKIKSLKKENKNINYLISHMDDANCDNAKKVFIRNQNRLEELEAKFDELYPKRGIFNRRDTKKRTKINFD
jgi:chromosome segregation ATPase